MGRLRKFGLALTFAATLAGGVLVAQPAQASTLNLRQCSVLANAVSNLESLAGKYPGSQLIAYLLAHARTAYATYCS